ncbi:hypothetical protein ACIBBE_42780 [Streptomyces sp. NPDC051644]|uniref:hypothetical protein n=1 Tax=Streptomyces sp. NPDC051644 TaxID=3365666 RepID=UPI0037A4A862
MNANGSRIAIHRAHKVKATCPAHDDAEPSLAADYKPAERKTVVYCHAGCHTEDVVAEIGLTLADLYDDPMPEEKKTRRRAIPRARGAKRTIRTKNTPQPKKPKKAGCSGAFREVARYRYEDANGQLVGVKVRRECTGCSVCEAEDAKPAKRITWERPAGDPPCACETCARVAGKGIELHMPENAPLYRTPQLAVAEQGSTVYLGEGEKVAETADQMGLLATTKPGSASTAWNPDHTALLAGQHVVILADRDPAGYKSAQDARAALLADAASVRVLQTPIESKGADLDDHRAAGLSLDALVAVPEELLVPDNEPGSAPDDAHADAVHPADPWAAGEPIPGDDGRPNRKDEYTVRHGELVKVTRKLIDYDDDGHPRYDVNFDTILGCYARIVRAETEDFGDGQEDNPGVLVATGDDQDEAEKVLNQRTTTNLVLQLMHPKQLDQPVLMRVSLKKFETGSWLHDLPWSDVYFGSSRSARDRIVSAIRAVSPDAQRVPIFAATGWRRTDSGGWMYVHAGGGITADGHVQLHTDFPGRLSLVKLPAPTTDPGRLRAAVWDALSIPQRTPAHVTVPLMGLAFRSPYFCCPSSITLFGLPGSYKTSISTTVMRFFAPRMDRNKSILSLSSTGATVNAVPEVLYRMKDVMMLGDDAAPDKSVKDASQRAGSLNRQQYGAEGRLRLKYVDGVLKLEDPRGPRGSLVTTSEVFASTESAQQRTLTLAMNRSEADLDQLRHMSTPQFADNCALLMASYIRWIAADYEAHCNTVRRIADEYATQLREYCGDRPSEHLGQFASGWHMMLLFLLEAGAASVEEVEDWWPRAWSALLTAADRERDLLENRSMHSRLLAYLATALSGKHAHLVGPDGKCPTDHATALRYGWMVTDSSSNDPMNPNRDHTQLRPGGAQLGVVTHVRLEDGTTEERVWLDHQQATRMALRMAAELDEYFTATSTVLTESLRQAEIISVEVEHTRKGTRRVNPRVPMPGGRRRVWDMPASALGLNVTDDDSGQGAEGDLRPLAPPGPLALFTPSAVSSTPPTGVQLAPVEARPALSPAPAASAHVAPSAVQQVPQLDAQEAAAPDTEPVALTLDDIAQPEPEPEPVRERSAGWTRPATTTGEPWRAAVAVADLDGLHLPDGTVVPLPPVEQLHAGVLADLVEQLGLGHGGSRRGTGAAANWRPDPGMIYVQDALAQALSLPDPDADDQDDEDEDEDYSARDGRTELARYNDHPFLARARAQGWTVDRWGTPTRIYRERPDGSRVSAMIEVTAWARTTAWGRSKGVEWLQDAPAADVLARRAQEIADTIGITYRHSAGATGHDLLKAMRPENGGAKAMPMKRTEMPPFMGKTPRLYSGRSWVRGLKARPGAAAITAAEREKQFLLSYDARAAYLAPCGSLRLGRGELTHLKGSDSQFDPNVPGYYVTTLPAWGEHGWFDLFAPRTDGRPRPYATPTLAYARELDIDFEVTEAWVWEESDRTLEPWYRHLRDSLKAMPTDVDPLVRAATKSTYTSSVGLFGSPKLAGNARKGIEASLMYRPDISDFVMAAQQVNLTRHVLRIGRESGLWPVGCMTDSLFYAVDDRNFATAVPGLPMGPNLGHFKPNGAALMSDVLAHLETDSRNTIMHAPLYTSPADWEAAK